MLRFGYTTRTCQFIFKNTEDFYSQSHRPFLTYAHINMERTCAEKPHHYIENRNSTGKKLKERRRDIIKNSEENERKENDRKKKYWA